VAHIERKHQQLDHMLTSARRRLCPSARPRHPSMHRQIVLPLRDPSQHTIQWLGWRQNQRTSSNHGNRIIDPKENPAPAICSGVFVIHPDLKMVF